MSVRFGQRLGVLLILLACGCVMEHAEEIGFLDRAAAKDTRKMAKEIKSCPAGQRHPTEQECHAIGAKDIQVCEGGCVDDK